MPVVWHRADYSKIEFHFLFLIRISFTETIEHTTRQMFQKDTPDEMPID